MKIIGEQRSDYFDIFCATCKERPTVCYLGKDPSMHVIRVHCPKCNGTSDIKLNMQWSGLPDQKISV